MKLLLVATALLAMAAPKKDPPTLPDPNASLAKEFGGKVWTDDDAIPNNTPESLKAWIAAQKEGVEVRRKGKEGPWPLSYVAVFKKPAAKGPITVRFFERGDPKHVVDQYSSDNDLATSVFAGQYDLDPDLGFNKDRTYVVKVGQLIKGKFQTYATGELTLK
jgi:hypothetical protein